MYNNKILSAVNLEGFNYEETKKNVKHYFMYVEKLKWEWVKLNSGKGLTINYYFAPESKKQPYIPIGKDVFNVSAKDKKKEQIKKYLEDYERVKSLLSDKEQLYIDECFINHRYEDEFYDLLGFNSKESKAFRKLKRSAVYKFADLLNLVVRKG